jgi:tetratricopeptide (TPR) repeat protein
VRAESLKKLADALMAEHTVSRSTATLEAAISIFEGILRLRSHDQKNRAEALGDLGNALFSYCFFHEEHQSRHTHCLDLLREALQLCPPGHSSRDRALHNLARALLFLDYEQQPGAWDILGESILLNRAALQLRPPGHSEREHSLNNLACGLLRSFEHCGDLDLLAEAIIMHRETLQLRPVGHLLRDTALQNLAIALMTSFEHQGGSETLVEAININRDALQLRPVGHPRRWTALNGLGNALWLSHAPKGFPELLSEPICLFREAVQLVPCTHPDRWMVLSNLARILVASFRHSHDRPVLAEAIALLRESLRLLPGEISQPEVVNGLAEALVASFEEDDNRDHLIEAMELHRQALNLRPPGHSRRMESLQRLGRLLCRRECQSWTEAFTLFREALETCPTGSPDRSDVLSDTSICLLDSGSPFFDIYQGMAHLSQAYADNFSHVNRRLRSAMWDLRRVESAYHVVAASLDPSTLEYCNSRVLALYAQVISLLPRAANFGLDHSTRLQAVTGLDDIARDAAARAILLGREYQALEMLEQGRGVFWAQTLHLRTGAFDGVPQDECDELQRLLRLLDHSASGFESSDQSAEQREPDLERQRRLNDEVEALICKIRGYAGLDRFLLPPTFDALVGALPDGFVVVVNTSKLGHHALLLDRGNRLAASLKLEPPPAGFDCTTLRLHIQREMEGTHDEGTRAMRKDHGRGGPLLDVLTLLWTSIVQPVISRLGLQVRCDILLYYAALTCSV